MRPIGLCMTQTQPGLCVHSAWFVCVFFCFFASCPPSFSFIAIIFFSLTCMQLAHCHAISVLPTIYCRRTRQFGIILWLFLADNMYFALLRIITSSVTSAECMHTGKCPSWNQGGPNLFILQQASVSVAFCSIKSSPISETFSSPESSIISQK